MKNNNIIKLITACSLLIFTGCIKDPLKVSPVGNYTTENYWRNQDDAVAGINGIYNLLFQEEGVGHGLYAFDDASDDISVDGDHSDYWEIERFKPTPATYQVYPTWTWAYAQIGRSNNAIVYIPKVPVMDEAIRSRSLGEAYFLRAHGYWQLYQIFGEVPIIVEDNLLNGNYNVPKSTVEQVAAQIEADLLKAADLLPESYGSADRGRVSKGAAWGLLSKLYLSWDKLDKAAEFGSKVITSSNYHLSTNYSDNFTIGSQDDNNEILFAIWNKQNYNNSPVNIYFTNRAWQGWGFHHPTQNFVDEFEANDPRKIATVLAVGDSIPYQTSLSEIDVKTADSTGNAYPVFKSRAGQQTGRLLPNQSLSGYYIKKYTAYTSDGTGQLNNDLKQPILRTADIYLVVAEAKIRQSGAGAGDAEINAVRTRAGLPAVSGATIQQLMHERRVELGGENIRFFDMLRWDKAGIINLTSIFNHPKLASPLPPYNGVVLVPARTFSKPKNYYCPIPQKVIDESKGILKQNPNY
ncbi:RagB/SusD family nutrient uptake outer membrane protein [Ferruginibacter sp.]|uniref:RagB/SusD family nutrient uptake outer membrane protein n=1 Tax=Ferruginibacter sp. TaxID=1940288 RepID=UPI00198F06AE|nr:RagB/SusD family nutrient uptake outer membrane protein [Ferruginibacter sp.]MBC7628388.1 RagB/SusD family nutrient uptake outer membrane protein [Ferruginibacter sp.]